MQLDGRHVYVNDVLSLMSSITPINNHFFTPPPHTSFAGLLHTLAPRGRRPLLPPVSCSAWASSSLSAGGELPHQGSSMWVVWSASGRATPLDLQTLIPTMKVAVVTRRPPQPVSFKATLKVATVM
jgi:hypothetical protein